MHNCYTRENIRERAALRTAQNSTRRIQRGYKQGFEENSRTTCRSKCLHNLFTAFVNRNLCLIQPKCLSAIGKTSWSSLNRIHDCPKSVNDYRGARSHAGSYTWLCPINRGCKQYHQAFWRRRLALTVWITGPLSLSDLSGNIVFQATINAVLCNDTYSHCLIGQYLVFWRPRLLRYSNKWQLSELPYKSSLTYITAYAAYTFNSSNVWRRVFRFIVSFDSNWYISATNISVSILSTSTSAITTSWNASCCRWIKISTVC